MNRGTEVVFIIIKTPDSPGDEERLITVGAGPHSRQEPCPRSTGPHLQGICPATRIQGRVSSLYYYKNNERERERIERE